jgi:hypothetical protein
MYSIFGYRATTIETERTGRSQSRLASGRDACPGGPGQGEQRAPHFDLKLSDDFAQLPV